MNEDRHQTRGNGEPGELTRLLRQADPAAGNPGLDPSEIARMRQTIVRAAGQAAPGGLWMGGWRDWMTPAMAASAMTVIVLSAWLITGGTVTEAPEVADAGATATGATPAPIDRGSGAPQAAPAPIDQETPPAIETPPAPIDRGASTAPEVALAPPDLVAETAPEPAPTNASATTIDVPSPPDRQARTVQFTAPRGTRIIWTLDPNFESPIAGQAPRQEQ